MTSEQIKLALEKMCEVVGGRSHEYHGRAFVEGPIAYHAFDAESSDIENAPAIQVLFDAITIEDERMVYYVVKIALEIAVYDGANTTFFRSRTPGLLLTERVLNVMHQWAVNDES